MLNSKIFTEAQNRVNRHAAQKKKKICKFTNTKKIHTVVFKKQKLIGSIYIDKGTRIKIISKIELPLTNNKHSYFRYEFEILKKDKTLKFNLTPE